MHTVARGHAWAVQVQNFLTESILRKTYALVISLLACIDAQPAAEECTALGVIYCGTFID